MGIEQVIDRYCEAWSTKEREKRAEIVNEVWAESGTYSDPRSDVRGREALVGLIDAANAQFPPGIEIKRTSAVDAHHNVARFAWALSGEGVAIEGIDIAFVSDDGTRLERVIGFFGPLAPEA